MSEVD
jgi:glycerol uptake facilitator-like aquaporin